MLTDRSPILTPRFDAALAYAARLHASQRRKGSDVPYVAHLLGVASLALGWVPPSIRRSRRCSTMRLRTRT